MKKILIITTSLPYPLTKGGSHGVFHHIDKLRNEYKISLLFKVEEDEDDSLEQLQLIWPNVSLYAYKEINEIPKKRSSITRFYNSLYSLPFNIKDRLSGKTKKETIVETDFMKENTSLYSSLKRIESENFIDYVSQICAKGFDIIQIEFYPLISLVHLLPHDVEKTFIHHEIRYIRNQIEMSFFNRISSFDTYLFNESKAYEIDTLMHYDKIVTVSDIDKLKLEKELPNKLILSSPSMVDFSKNITYNYKFNNKLTFVGSSTHFPNIDGIKWFISEVWNTLSTQNQNLELHIIGKGWDKYIAVENSDKIFLHGYVENLEDILLNTISIVPIRIGSGMRMKILDAILYKIPFVTTVVGVEGLDFKDNEDCLIADNAIDFNKAIETLIANEPLQLKLIEESNKTLQQTYNEKTIIDKRKLVYEA